MANRRNFIGLLLGCAAGCIARFRSGIAVTGTRFDVSPVSTLILMVPDGVYTCGTGLTLTECHFIHADGGAING